MYRFITIGSCLSNRISVCFLKNHSSKYLSSTRHNRVDKIVDTYIEKTKAELSYDYLSNLIFKEDIDRDVSQQTDNQFTDRKLGRTCLDPKTAIKLTDVINEEHKIDFVLYDPFCDLLFKLLFSKKGEMSFFLHTKYSKNWRDFFTLESTRMPMEKVEKYYEKIVSFFTQSKQSKFIFINFPLLHHHNEEVIKRVEQINNIFSRNNFLKNNSFFIPATDIPLEYINEKDKNHLKTYKNRSIYEDYGVVIQTILNLNFSPQKWNDIMHIAKEESRSKEQFFLDNMREKFSDQFKEFAEMKYWEKHRQEKTPVVKGNPFNVDYEQYYTTHFNLSPDFYKNKRILDIGCGPCGTLEWANSSLERIGLDSLVDEYSALGIRHHKTKYVNAKAESIPFEKKYFDIITVINSLTYLDDLNLAIMEIKRVLKPGGLLLLLTDTDKIASIRKPQKISCNIIKRFSPELLLIEKEHYQLENHMIYSSFKKKVVYDDKDNSNRPGLLAAKFCKLSSN